VFNLYQKNSSGTGQDELLLKTANDKLIDDWSADGRYIVYEETDPKTKKDLWVLPLFGDRKPVRLLGTPFNERNASLSPDGRWIAYDSDETGQNQVYVQSFPTSFGKWQVSTGNRSGQLARWRFDGKEMFYDAAGPMMAVDLTGTVAGREFKAGTPRELFFGLTGGLLPHNYDVSRAGDRFLLDTIRNISGSPAAAPIVVVLNWKSGLKQ
jgi:eukaryotic-like serine/threonine-protein kinase